MNPAFLETYCNAQEIYRSQKQKLEQNLNYFNFQFNNSEKFIFDSTYPIIYFEDKLISNKLLENKIIPTSFKYTNDSGKLNRIVITANHSFADLEHLLAQLS